MFQGILESPQEFPGLRETFESVVRLEMVYAIPEFVITIRFFFFPSAVLPMQLCILCIYFQVSSYTRKWGLFCYLQGEGRL